ncbi:MAG: EscR/YscR/HrcR family type III secretion system export apparatus protein [Deltaproteobacteria bacterium]|nr:MAG: EscR/YscR/HrcR family type III secretion system export apparatus protein [Deltaproteobacteria bacterium]
MTDQPIVMIVLLAALSLLPFLLVMLTSFVKIAVVLAIVRNALGAGNIPPSMVVTGLALVLTMFVMAPVAGQVYDRVEPALAAAQGKSLTSTETVTSLVRAGERAGEPIREFLTKHAHARDRAMFTDLARRMREPAARADVSDSDFMVLAPAFVTSELKEAFAIGFLLFIPFLVIDMVVSNVLLSLGMHMMSPSTVSLPFKLLLFVLIDGWQLLTQGLVLGYT